MYVLPRQRVIGLLHLSCHCTPPFSPRSFDARDICSLLSSFLPNTTNERSLGYITLIVTHRVREPASSGLGSIRNVRNKKLLLARNACTHTHTLKRESAKAEDGGYAKSRKIIIPKSTWGEKRRFIYAPGYDLLKILESSRGARKSYYSRVVLELTQGYSPEVAIEFDFGLLISRDYAYFWDLLFRISCDLSCIGFWECVSWFSSFIFKALNLYSSQERTLFQHSCMLNNLLK